MTDRQLQQHNCKPDKTRLSFTGRSELVAHVSCERKTERPSHSEREGWQLRARHKAQNPAQKAGQLLQLAAVGMADHQGQEEDRERTAIARHRVD